MCIQSIHSSLSPLAVQVTRALETGAEHVQGWCVATASKVGSIFTQIRKATQLVPDACHYCDHVTADHRSHFVIIRPHEPNSGWDVFIVAARTAILAGTTFIWYLALKANQPVLYAFAGVVTVITFLAFCYEPAHYHQVSLSSTEEKA